MTLQSRILKLLSDRALPSHALYAAVGNNSSEAVDAALKALREGGEVIIQQGRFQRPRNPIGADGPLPKSPRYRPSRAALGQPLTSREITVATVAREGGTAREMAEKLGMSHHTLKQHLTSIYRKLGIDGKGELRGDLRDDLRPHGHKGLAA